jgi:hypothetical protein
VIDSPGKLQQRRGIASEINGVGGVGGGVPLHSTSLIIGQKAPNSRTGRDGDALD